MPVLKNVDVTFDAIEGRAVFEVDLNAKVWLSESGLSWVRAAGSGQLPDGQRFTVAVYRRLKRDELEKVRTGNINVPELEVTFGV